MDYLLQVPLAFTGVNGQNYYNPQGHDGLFYLDHTLSDEMAAKHWLVKFSVAMIKVWKASCSMKHFI